MTWFRSCWGKEMIETEHTPNEGKIASVLEKAVWHISKELKPKKLELLFSQNKDKTFNINALNDDLDEDGGHVLIYCIKEGGRVGKKIISKDCIACCSLLLENGVDINHKDHFGRTALFWTVGFKCSQLVELLVKFKADPTIEDQDGRNALEAAIQLGAKECVQAMLAKEPEKIVNHCGKNGIPYIIVAAQKGFVEILQLLLANGADVNAKEKRTNRTAIFYTIEINQLEALDLLLRYNPSLTVVDHKGENLIHRCCEIPDTRFLEQILQNGQQKISKKLMDQQRSSDGKTPVILACEKGNSEQLKKLLDAGADVTVKDEEGKTALHYCADNLETQCAEMLLEACMTLLNAQDEQMYTPMHLAVLAGNENLLKLLIEKGADIHCLDENYHTLVHLATASGHPKILEILILHEADLSSADNYNAYPIHYAAQLTSSTPGISDPKAGEKILKRLLDAGVAYDVLDSGGRQPLLWAACSGNAESCRVLIKAGADVNAIDKDDLSALHCAASRGKANCIELLKKSGANVNMSDKNKCTPLFYAITLGNIDCTRALLKAGADPNHVDMMGRSPAHCAAIRGCLDTIKLLEKDKGDLWIPSSQGDYPVHEAAQGGYIDVVKYLLKQRNTKDAVNVKNHAGRTCLHIAAITNNLPLCKTLLNQTVEKNPVMRHKGKEYTPYDIAVSRGYNDLAEYLRSQGCYSLADLNNLDKIKEQERDTKSAKSVRSKRSVKLEKTPEETDEELKVEAGPSTKVDIVLEPVQEEHKAKTAIASVAPAGTAIAPKTKHEQVHTDEKKVIKDKEDKTALTTTEHKENTVEDKDTKDKGKDPVKTPISWSRVSLQEKEIDRVEKTLPDEENLREPEILQKKERPTQDQKEMGDRGSTESLEDRDTTDAKVYKDKGKAKRNKTGLVKDYKDSLLYKYSRGPHNLKPEERGRRRTKKHRSQSPKNVNKLIHAIQESVRTYENLRNNSRQTHQMKRAQLYSGPLHDIVMFGKLMDTYRHGGFTTMDEDDLDNQPNDWDEYLREQLKFVTHIYEEDKDKPGYEAISDTAKEQHDKLTRDVQDFKKTTDGQREKFDDSDDRQKKKKKAVEAEMDQLAQRTAAMFESVNLEAGETLKCARDLNDTMGKDIKQKRKEQIRTSNSPRELTDLKMQELDEEHQAQLAEMEKHRQSKHKTWHKKKDEEMRRKLLQAYRPHHPPQVFTKASRRRSKSATHARDKDSDSAERTYGGGETSISPAPLDARRSVLTTAQRPRSGHSPMSAAQFKLKDDKRGVKMTEYGLRKVRHPPSPNQEQAANWTKKYNGNIRERHSLCFVEPKVYTEILKEEKEIKSRYPRMMKNEHVNGAVTNGDVDLPHESPEPTKS